MKVLVVGGAGYIGSHTVVELIANNHDPVILDNFSNSNRSVLTRLEKISNKKVKIYDLDYLNSNGLEKVIKENNIEAVIHFAAYKAVGESVKYPMKYYLNNVSGFIGLLTVLARQGVNKIVLSSSAAVYGDPPLKAVTEETVCIPTSPYGYSKLMCEQILKDAVAANPSLQATSLRYFNVVGAHKSAIIGELSKSKPQNLLPIITQATARVIPPLVVYGDDYDTPDGSCLRDYVHVVDLAKAHVKAINNLRDYSVYNVGTGKPTSVFELIKVFERVNKIKVPNTIGKRRPGDPPAYYARVDKIEKNLNWHAINTVEDAVRDAWRWQQTLAKT